MRPKRLGLITALLAAIAAVALPGAAQASTQGTADREAHPNVAFLMFYGPDATGDGANDRFRCSGTLVSPTVVLTAAHCTDGVVGRVLVTFDPTIAETEDDLELPTAADVSVGYTQDQLANAGYYSGTAHTHPAYSGFTDADNWNDVGVVTLDQASADVTPAPIAPQGRLSEIKKSALSKTAFTAVGYGTEVRKPDSGPQKPTAENFPLIRRYVELRGQKLTDQILQTNGSSTNGKGTGSTCFGDSGGPVFLDGQVVAVTSYGNNNSGNCRGVSGYQRVDIDSVQSFLAEFGVTPAS